MKNAPSPKRVGALEGNKIATGKAIIPPHRDPIKPVGAWLLLAMLKLEKAGQQ